MKHIVSPLLSNQIHRKPFPAGVYTRHIVKPGGGGRNTHKSTISFGFIMYKNAPLYLAWHAIAEHHLWWGASITSGWIGSDDDTVTKSGIIYSFDQKHQIYNCNVIDNSDQRWVAPNKGHTFINGTNLVINTYAKFFELGLHLGFYANIVIMPRLVAEEMNKTYPDPYWLLREYVTNIDSNGYAYLNPQYFGYIKCAGVNQGWDGANYLRHAKWNTTYTGPRRELLRTYLVALGYPSDLVEVLDVNPITWYGLGSFHRDASRWNYWVDWSAVFSMELKQTIYA